MLRLHKVQLLVALSLLLFSINVAAAPTTNDSSLMVTDTKNDTNHHCPPSCECTLHIKPNNKYLHAKCLNINSLLEAHINPDYPIHSIDLSNLGLTRLSYIFEEMPDLTTINLSHNELHEIGHFGRRIKRLNLKNNRITSNKLVKMPRHVQTLNLQHNDITYLPLELKNLKQLSQLEISNNDINCSCETLEVRNWLQERHVFMETPVICAYPVETKGKSWLQVRQSDICEKEKRGWHIDDEENELMLGDQPMENVTDNEEEEEVGKVYIPIYANKNDEELSLVEGSGDMASPHTTDIQAVVSEMNDEADAGSGSGDGIFLGNPLPHEHLATYEDIVPGSVQAGLQEQSTDPRRLDESDSNVTHSPDLFDKFKLGIFQANESTLTDRPVTEDTIVPVVHHGLNINPITDGPDDADKVAEAVQHANVSSKEDSSATYLLLAVIGLLVIGLIIFVGFKRCNKKNRPYNGEALRQTELLDMDKKNLGKPLQRNGNEHAPLIGEKTTLDNAKPINGASKKPYDSNDVKDGSNQQLINGNGKEVASPADTTDPQAHEYHPITPRYPTPKSPRASKYAQYPPQSTENNNNTTYNDAHLVASPKGGRYSPVYSPETGRVKIKLTETPRPKTPMLVTRSRSNAGDIITTPVHFNKAALVANNTVQP